MSDWPERLARIRLARTPGIGPLTFSRLLQTYKSGLAAVDALPDRIRASGHRPVKLVSLSAVERELDLTERHGARIVLNSDPDFPQILRDLSPGPPIVTVLGRTDLTTNKAVSIVGARNASAAGMRLAHTLARDLGEAGLTIVSGLARGIDTAAHSGSLDTGTVAVIAGGIDNIYPIQNTDLRHQIAEKGLIVSESPFGYEPRAKDFPRRNRLVTGLSLGVVVVEAAQRSGSLISARCAAEQGREVMAVPGSPLDPRTKGSNGLIRSGATLVETAEHVLEALTPIMGLHQPSLFESNSSDSFDSNEIEEADGQTQSKILSALSPTPVSLADISSATGIPLRICTTALVELELAGLAHSLPGGLVQRSV